MSPAVQPLTACLCSLLIFVEVAYFLTGVKSQTHRLFPVDSYQLLGKPGLRLLGQCNITYAWLVPPPASTLDAYGHALACNRLQLHNGHVFRAVTEVESQHGELSHTAEEEMKRINKEMLATMADLSRLDALLRADHMGNSRLMSFTGNQLADGNRYFYLADRIGNLNIMVLLRPGQQIKLQLIDPISPDHLVTPQHVLCSRKQCPISLAPASTTTNPATGSTNNKSLNNSQGLSGALSRAERQNRELYIQLIISRVACALLSFLCIVFAVAALTLCVRIRKIPHCYGKKAHQSELSVCREPHPSPSYLQPNGKLTVGQPSPVFLTEQMPRQHISMTQMPSDTASVSNLMTGSNLSECGALSGIHGVPMSYTALGSQYGQFSAYPISAGRSSVYNENSGLLTFLPVNSHGVLIPYQNGSSSPVPSNHSLNDAKTGIVRSGSLGRYNGSNVMYTESGRRKVLRMNRKHLVTKPEDSQLLQSHGMNKVASNNHEDQEIRETILKTQDQQVENDLLSFEPPTANHLQVIHRYPNEHSAIYGKFITPCGSVNGDRISVRSNNLNLSKEPCISVVRKPALAN